MVKGEGRWCQWWSETRGRRRSRRSLREPPARKQTDRPSDNEGEKSAKRHTRTQSSFLGQRDRSRRMGVPARGGRTRGAGGGRRRRGSPSRARGEGGGVSPSRGVGRRRDRGAGWTATPPPLAPPPAPGDRGAVHGGEILKRPETPRAAGIDARERATSAEGGRETRGRGRGVRGGSFAIRGGAGAAQRARAALGSRPRACYRAGARRGEKAEAGRVGAAGRGARGAGSSEGRTSRPCSASLALYTRSARDRPARSSGAVIGLMAGGRGRASANAARVGCGPMGPRRSRPRVREPSSERP